ncbi:MAG: argininosuccinate synthase, partial [Gemmatimonadaceae bacterium]
NVTQERVNGEVTLRLFKGAIAVSGRSSEFALYDENFVTFGADDVYNQADAAGFIRLYGLSTKVQALRDQARDAAASPGKRAIA